MNKKGVSLLETLVVITITSIMAISVMSILSSAVRIQSQALYQQHVLDQATYALELMTKEIKMARRLRPPTGFPPESRTLACGITAATPESVYVYDSDGSSITFLSQSNNCVTYSFADNTIKMAKFSSTTSPINFFDLPIISEDIKVTDMAFYVSGDSYNPDGSCVNSAASPCLQPRVTVSLTIETAFEDGTTEPMTLQTTLSSRNINRIYAQAQ